MVHWWKALWKLPGVVSEGPGMDLPLNEVATTYVQVARGMRFYGSSLVLEDLAPSTVYLACSHGATVGHLPTGLFLDEWYREPDGVASRSVPAVLSLLDASRPDASDVRLTLSLPRIRDAGLEYQTRLLHGELPPASGACVLFIALSPCTTALGEADINPTGGGLQPFPDLG